MVVSGWGLALIIDRGCSSLQREPQGNYFWAPGHMLSDIIAAATPAFRAPVQQKEGVFRLCSRGRARGGPHASTHTLSTRVLPAAAGSGPHRCRAALKEYRSKEAGSQ